ncbi:lipocalin-like domain-containing protein [Methylobacterium sp. Leaf111]|uniref:lipocalin-like domain-containing protein n=1 Tax=Methylobacterium sp. Leaf111 TaxID=1736257 RepID=UPI0009E84EC7|nr:lipocalin-like domain-containing protein [Methylobacterium sp. Leaf111]
MRVLIALTVLCMGVSTARATDAQDLIGNWRLTTATRMLVDTNELIDAYGGLNPTGWLNYSPDGRMMVVVAYQGRKKPIANDKMSDEDRVGLHKSFFAYAGTYSFDGKNVNHNIDTSWNEVWTGTSQIRSVEYKDNNLIITTPPFKFNVDGKMSILTLTYKKFP